MLKLATLCYVKRPGQTLMLHRIKKAGDMHAGKWNGLGGKFEPGETPEACAIREIYEESGLRVVKPELHGFLTFPAFRPDEDWYAFVFVAHHFSGELIDSPEGVLAWIDDDKLLDLPLWEGDPIFLRWLEEERFFSARFTYVDGQFIDYEAFFYPGAASLPAPTPQQRQPIVQPQPESQATPLYTPADDTYCWVCGGPVIKRNCKIVCQSCGFTRDCSDP
jgi:8-oxo-dGTP diphosphatase